MIIRVVLEGGVPWGFRVDSDSRDHPPRISKVRARGKADRAGLRPNDVILSVNGRSTAGLRDVDLIDLIQQSQQVLRLELERAVHQSAAQVDGWETVNDTPSCVSDARSESKVHPAGVQLSQHLISVKDCNTHATADWPGHNVSRSSSLPHKDEQDLSLTEQSEQEKATRLSSPQNPTITHLVQKKDDVVHSDDDDVSEMTSGLDSESSASATSHLQELNTYNGVHEQPPDRRQSSSLSNSNTASRPTLHQAEPDEFRGSINASSSITSEGQNASLLATKSVTETQTAASGVQKQNSVNDADSLLPNDEVFVTEKRPVRMNRFKGIGPRDEATGIPIASKSLVEESCQKEWYRQMYLAMHKLTGLKCSPMFVFAGNDPDPRLSVACRLSSSSSTDNSPINAALRRSVGRQESTESTACRQSCSRSRRSSSCSSSPRISPHPSFTHCQNRFGQPSDVMSKTASPPMIPSSRDTTCDNFTAPGDRQVLVTASATPNGGNHGDPPSQHSAQMLNGGGGFGNKYESVGDGNLVNGRSNHDTKIPNDVSHMHVSGSKANSQRDSVQRLCALYNYNPRHADELQLNKGDVIYLVDVCDDGWFLGTSARTGQFGTFPGNYVRPVT